MAIKTYTKGKAVQLSTNFKSTEFDCHGSGCCAQTKIDDDLVKYVQKIRDHFGKSVNISSGYRCETYNKNIGGATKSRHSKGQAADIYISGVAPAEIAKYAESIGILGIGLYETDKDGHFVHIDTRTSKYFWYGQNEEYRSTFGGTPVKEEPKVEAPAAAPKKEMYRVRKSWKDAKSQLGAYTVLANAKKTCDKAGAGYYIFNSAGEVVYPEEKKVEEPTIDIIDTSKVDISAINDKVMWDFFKSKGLNDFGVAGLMGNLYAESGLRPANLQNSYVKSLGMSDAQYTASVDSGAYTNFVNDSAGYGLAQWTYWSLKQDMLNYFKEKGKSIGDGQTQMEFLVHQLSTSYSSVWATLQTATSILEASNAVLLKFERPADQSTTVQNKRAEFGKVYYDKYAKTEEIKIEVPKEGVNGKMKYSAFNKPLVCMQTNSTCYRGTNKMTVKGVLWHSTGANNPNLKRYIQPSDNAVDKEEMLKLLGTNKYRNDWNHIEHQAGLNCWIGKLADGTVTTIQTMPWDYRPWGCASGAKGSCNNGWIQFEICEDGLTDKTYFDKVYKEACEITAYLCDMFNIDPKGTVRMNGVDVPTILCHQDSYKLGLGSNHGDIYHWFQKYGKSMETAREDVAQLMGNKTSVIEPAEPGDKSDVPAAAEIYRVRKAWEDVKSQIGAYSQLQNAKSARDKAGNGYYVFNSKGEIVYPELPKKDDIVNAVSGLRNGQEVSLREGAKYSSGAPIPSWLFGRKLYVREIRNDGKVVVSTLASGAITGVVFATDLVPYEGASVIAPKEPDFEPYLVKIVADVLNVRAGAGTNFAINTQVSRGQVYTIIGEKSGWGKLKSGAGWISLDYTKKI